MKQYFPNVEYNRSKRNKSVVLYSLLALIFGGGAVACFLTNMELIGVICIFALLLFALLIPSIISTNPVKNEPVIEIGSKTVKLYGKEEIPLTSVVAVSVCITVPKMGQTRDERQKNLKEIASKKPDEPVFGTCDLVVKDAKGKEVVKYQYIEDCIGALEDFIAAGVKKYRILYSMEKLNEVATYQIVLTPSGNSKYDALSEKDRMMQLL
ncbi:MAG: hypothetical protein IKD14_03350 [Clostridia bacterium]|nr:hypothetical protein [Clostridia bacterium]